MVPGPGPPKTKRIIAYIDYEPDPADPERTEGFVVSAFKNACRNMREGTSAVISLYDEENGDLLGGDVSRKPSMTIQKAWEDFLAVIRDLGKSA